MAYPKRSTRVRQCVQQRLRAKRWVSEITSCSFRKRQWARSRRQSSVAAMRCLRNRYLGEIRRAGEGFRDRYVHHENHLLADNDRPIRWKECGGSDARCQWPSTESVPLPATKAGTPDEHVLVEAGRQAGDEVEHLGVGTDEGASAVGLHGRAGSDAPPSSER